MAPLPPHRRPPRRPRGRAWLPRATIALGLAFALFPVYWLALVAFRPREEVFTHPVSLLPSSFTLASVDYVWLGSRTNDPVAAFLVTSLIVAGAATLLATALGGLCAYAIARHRVGGRGFSLWILSQRFLPPIALVVPLYILARDTGLYDTHAGLIILYTAFNLPLAVWLLLGFIESLPVELEEAALLDGASRLQALRHVVLPLLKPGLAVTAIFVFTFSWNEFVVAWQLAGEDVATITVYLPRLRSAIAELYGEMAAASLLSVLPAIALAWALQRCLVRGLTLGGGREL